MAAAVATPRHERERERTIAHSPAGAGAGDAYVIGTASTNTCPFSPKNAIMGGGSCTPYCTPLQLRPHLQIDARISSRLATAPQCQAAAAALGKTWNGAGSWSTSPAGCLDESVGANRGMFFNSHSDGHVQGDQAPVCMIARASSNTRAMRQSALGALGAALHLLAAACL